MAELNDDQLVAIYYFIIGLTAIFLLFGRRKMLMVMCIAITGILLILWTKKKRPMTAIKEPFTILSRNYSSPFVTYNCDNANTLSVNGGVPEKTFGYTADPSLKSNTQKPFLSYNQLLAGNCNPKFNETPIVTAPSNDLEKWRANEFVVHSSINDYTRYDAVQSGYEVQIPNKESFLSSLKFGPKTIERYEVPTPMISDNAGNLVPMCRPGGKSERSESLKYPQKSSPKTIERYEVPTPMISDNVGNLVPMCKYPQKSSSRRIQENYRTTNKGERLAKPIPHESFEKVDDKTINPMDRYDYNDDVNVSYGYTPDNLQYNLPVNMDFGKCQRDKDFASYNENLFTQPIEPNVYVRTQVIEQANANAGISFTQQFEPTSQDDVYSNGNKTVMFTQHDPRILEPIVEEDKPSDEVTLDSVYDPRLSGYGTSYRSYLDPMTNSRKYMYNDIDAIRMPNYVTRNKLDVMSFGNAYGPRQDKPESNDSCDIHQLANETFLDWTGQQRLELQERAMRKNNAVSWQRRIAPIRTTANGGGTAGSTRIG